MVSDCLGNAKEVPSRVQLCKFLNPENRFDSMKQILLHKRDILQRITLVWGVGDFGGGLGRENISADLADKAG